MREEIDLPEAGPASAPVAVAAPVLPELCVEMERVVGISGRRRYRARLTKWTRSNGASL